MGFDDPDFGDDSVTTVNYTLQFALPETNFETVLESAMTNDLELAITHEELMKLL